jgi:hypothetical protein
MKIIEAMKLIKELQVKSEDLRKKVGENCANLDFETTMYKEPQAQIGEWIQAHTDINKKILELRFAIQRTNIVTVVEIEIGGKNVKKTIAEWIHRRRDLAKADETMWSKLTDRGLKEQRVQTVSGGPVTEIKVKRYFDPLLRDAMIEIYRSEPGIIDRTLEVTNATTELVN